MDGGNSRNASNSSHANNSNEASNNSEANSSRDARHQHLVSFREKVVKTAKIQEKLMNEWINGSEFETGIWGSKPKGVNVSKYKEWMWETVCGGVNGGEWITVYGSECTYSKGATVSERMWGVGEEEVKVRDWRKIIMCKWKFR
jgi:hypothetical protein